ncbi:proactivator polypeptide-like protein 1-like protein [Trifolium pratense]|uniref:Pulmonary surfactant-associated protein B n=2 Tax=Trifolium pratense TaxID=57577 RepID=A0A2K3NIY1_TRIPR|nr:proactivator polypeptide-like protein 1-like protein [Trifolium pratense]
MQQLYLKLYGKSDACTICEEYTTEVLDYLKDNNTHVEIIDSLHNTCHHLLSFNQQCLKLVDYYVPLFFSEIARINPGELCDKFNLCESAKNYARVRGNSCGFCKDTVAQLLVELNDPDTKIEIMEKLLKACNSLENHTKECKRMVFEYGPLIIINAEKFLKTNDICTTIHACPASSIVSQKTTINEEIPMLSDS